MKKRDFVEKKPRVQLGRSVTKSIMTMTGQHLEPSLQQINAKDKDFRLKIHSSTITILKKKQK